MSLLIVAAASALVVRTLARPTQARRQNAEEMLAEETELSEARDFPATVSHEIRMPLNGVALPLAQRLPELAIAPNDGRARVLVVEDHAVNQMLATRLLSKFGCDVEIAENGRLACERTADNRYDLVFMDCQMPEMDGLEATRIIRRREAGTGGRLPIVALTANAMSEDRQRCLDAGMDDYLAKPYSAADFQRTLARWCKTG